MWAVIRPTKMTDDSHTPSTDAYGGLPDEYHDAIFLYACWKASSYADDESGAMGERYRSAYEGQDGSAGSSGSSGSWSTREVPLVLRAARSCAHSSIADRHWVG